MHWLGLCRLIKPTSAEVANEQKHPLLLSVIVVGADSHKVNFFLFLLPVEKSVDVSTQSRCTTVFRAHIPKPPS